MCAFISKKELMIGERSELLREIANEKKKPGT